MFLHVMVYTWKPNFGDWVLVAGMYLLVKKQDLWLFPSELSASFRNSVCKTPEARHHFPCEHYTPALEPCMFKYYCVRASVCSTVYWKLFYNNWLNNNIGAPGLIVSPSSSHNSSFYTEIVQNWWNKDSPLHHLYTEKWVTRLFLCVILG